MTLRLLPTRAGSSCHAGGERIPVLAFIVNRACSGYAGSSRWRRWSSRSRRARGKYGSSAEYLFQTQAALESHGILDERVKRLAERVRAYLAAAGQASAAGA